MNMRNSLMIFSHSFTAISLLLASVPAFAVGDLVLQQSPQLITIAVYVASGLMALLLLVVAFQVLTYKRKMRNLLKEHTWKQSSQDTLPIGLLHINLEGKIIYANSNACRLLGRLGEKLRNQSLISIFASQDAQQIEQALVQTDCSFKVKARASNLYLSLIVGAVNQNNHEPYSMVCLSDENKPHREHGNANIERRKAEEQLKKLQTMYAAMQLGEITIDVKDDSFSYNERVEQLIFLQSDTTEKGQASPLRRFTDSIHHADILLWSKALLAAKSNGHAQALCRLKKLGSTDVITYIATQLSISARLTQDGECTHIYVAISDNSEAEQIKQQLDIKSQQHQALISASSNAMYSIDESGNLLWSNATFNTLIRRFEPNAKSQNMLKLDFFPDAIKKLHQRTAGLSGRSYNTEFVIVDPNDESETNLNLTLAFYTCKDRLNDNNKIGIIGILQDTRELQQTKRKERQLISE